MVYGAFGLSLTHRGSDTVGNTCQLPKIHSTLFMTKVYSFAHPIYDLTKNLIKGISAVSVGVLQDSLVLSPGLIM